MKLIELFEGYWKNKAIAADELSRGIGRTPVVSKPKPAPEPQPTEGFVVLINGKEWTKGGEPRVFPTYRKAQAAGEGIQRTRRVTIDIKPYKK